MDQGRDLANASEFSSLAATATPACPVCRNLSCFVRRFVEVEARLYWRCDECLATFLTPTQYCSPAQELATYTQHNNDVKDLGYRRFLSKIVVPLLSKLAVGAAGLDYGCGPGPALAAMMEENGHGCQLYDPLFFPDTSVLNACYDYVTCTEAAEHFHQPAAEFDRMGAALKPGGWLAVMTCFQTDDARFASWHYRRDPTHVVFYRRETLQHMAQQRGWQYEFPCKDVVLMQKPMPAAGILSAC